MILDSSTFGLIAIALHAHGSLDGVFHWSLIIPTSDTTVMRYHASQLNRNIWAYRSGYVRLDGSMNIAVVVFIGHMGRNSFDGLNEILKTVNVPAAYSSSAAAFDSKVWVREAIETLASYGIITCPSPAHLIAEVSNYGAPIHSGVLLGTRDPIITQSQYSS